MSIGEYHLFDLNPTVTWTVYVVRETVNEDNDPVGLDTHSITGCRVAFSPAGEDRSTGERVITTAEVRMPNADADVLGTDRIALPGDPPGRARWTVEGEPARSPFPGGGCLVQIRREVG